MPIEVVLEGDCWKAVDLVGLANKGFYAAMQYFELNPKFYGVEMLACDDNRMIKLNSYFCGIERATNVLSWPSVDRSPKKAGQFPLAITSKDRYFLGDIAISYDTCSREVNGSKTNIEHHVLHLIVHAILHLMGFDHKNVIDADLMETIEVEILGKMGIDSPYES